MTRGGPESTSGRTMKLPRAVRGTRADGRKACFRDRSLRRRRSGLASSEPRFSAQLLAQPFSIRLEDMTGR